MLKVAQAPEEVAGGHLMAHWSGAGADGGAAQVYAHAPPALLMARGGADLVSADLETQSRAFAGVARRLHRAAPISSLIPIERRFETLLEWTGRETSFQAAREESKTLLAEARGQPRVTLHGDLHHYNILDFGDGQGRQRWRAIDPKGLLGPAEVEAAPFLLNPFADDPRSPFGADLGDLPARVGALCRATGFSEGQVIRWLRAYAALSALWSEASGESGDRARAILAEALRL